MSDIDNALFQLKNIARSGSTVNAQQAVERRVLQIMFEFPELGDDGVATIVHDEILNQVGNEPALLQWATEATAARLRRTLMLNAIRQQQQAMMPAPPAPVAIPPLQPRREPESPAPQAGNALLYVLLLALVGAVIAFGYGACGR